MPDKCETDIIKSLCVFDVLPNISKANTFHAHLFQLTFQMCGQISILIIILIDRRIYVLHMRFFSLSQFFSAVT